MASPQARRWSQIPWPLGTCCYRSLGEAQGHSSIQLVLEPLTVHFLTPLQTNLPLLLHPKKQKLQPLSSMDIERAVEETSHPYQWQNCLPLSALSQATQHCFTLFARQILGINKLASIEKSMGLKHCRRKKKKFPFLSHCLMTG